MISFAICCGVFTGGGGGCVWMPLETKIMYGFLCKSKGIRQKNLTSQVFIVKPGFCCWCGYPNNLN